MPVAIPPARTAQREADRIREVFLSATARDLATYRKEVADALANVDAGVFLQEKWAGAATDVVTLSLARLADSDAYLGVFGFRYGWIPDGFGKSITELECDKALDLWAKQTVPPIFWFMPAPESDIAGILTQEADRVLAEEFPNDPAKRAESRQLQKAFCDRLRGMGRFVTSFTSVQTLREHAITSVSKWNRDILKAAIDATRSAVTSIPLDELGGIDREDQRDAIETALSAQKTSGSPGLCLAVHGSEDAGHSAFLAALEQSIKWDIGGEVHAITPSHDQFDTLSLASATLAEMAPGQGFQEPTMERVAAAIGDRCRIAPMVMILQQLDRLSGGLDAFRTAFWVPLLEAARALPATAPARHPFVVVVAVTTPIATPLPAGMLEKAPAASADYSGIVVLPELNRLTEKDVATWLRGHNVGLNDRTAIAGRVTKDGVPRGVYDRLNLDGFWKTLQQ